MSEPLNVDPQELEKFSQLAHRWWDPDSEFKPLHEINPLRLEWIDQHCAAWRASACWTWAAAAASCPRAMAARGAEVTGIDLSDKALKVAQLHLLESGAQVDLPQDRGRGAGARAAVAATTW